MLTRIGRVHENLLPYKRPAPRPFSLARYRSLPHLEGIETEDESSRRTTASTWASRWGRNPLSARVNFSMCFVAIHVYRSIPYLRVNFKDFSVLTGKSWGVFWDFRIRSIYLRIAGAEFRTASDYSGPDDQWFFVVQVLEPCTIDGSSQLCCLNPLQIFLQISRSLYYSI
jgi:hypothetical protein